MPIANYVRPQTEIYQQLEITLDAVDTRMTTCVIGPSYDLYRYGHEELPSYEYTTSGQDIPYTYVKDPVMDYVVDPNSVKVYAEGWMANLAEFDQKVTIDKKSQTILRLKNGFFAAEKGLGLATELLGYGVQIGDVLKVQANEMDEVTRSCTILDIVGKAIPASVTAEVVEVASSGSKPTITLVSDATDFTAETGTTYVLTVSDEGTIVVTDTAGIDIAAIFTPEEGTEVDIGAYGPKIKLTNVTSLQAGDTFAVSCIAESASTSQFDGVLLDRIPFSVSNKPADGTLYKVTLLKPYDGEVSPFNGIESPFTSDGEKVTINPDLAIYIADQRRYCYFEDATGNLFVSFRVQVYPKRDDYEEKFYLKDITDVQDAFGTVDQDNDLAYGCYAALEGAAGREIYAIRTRGKDLNAFMAAAESTQHDSDMYAYVVLTDDVEIAKAVAEYNVSLCLPDVKMWRRTFWGIESPGEYVIANSDKDGVPLRASFSNESGDSNSTNNTLVQLSDENNFNFKDINADGVMTEVRIGDYVRLDSTGQKYRVYRILSTRELLLETGPKTEITVPKNISLIHADTPQNRREYIQQICSNFNSLRKTVVWSDNATYMGDVVYNKFLAAYIAGLASSVVPQQSLTRSEVSIVDNVSRLYTLYTREELDDIARYGCLVVTQDTKGGVCYVRHNLTTETDKGILYYEESCIRNIDNMSFQTDAILQKYIGRANVTPSALRAIYTDLTSLFDSFTQNSPSDLLGPQLISYSDLSVVQDPTLKSRVIVRVKWYVPAPLNNIRVYEQAFVADVTMEPITSTATTEA